MRRLALLSIAIGLALFQAFAWGASIAELQSSGHLEISSEIVPAEDIVPGQRVELAITIATDAWFTGGTRLEIPEVAGLVIIQTNNFASNSSENRVGQNWVVQRWALDVYPQREGNFTLPAITAMVKVSDQDANSVEGELHSPELKFRTALPEPLLRAEHWVAAPSFKVSQSFDRELEQLQPGEAFQREIVFEATDVMAMMLPAFDVEQLEGLAAYPEPSSLSNSSNRGNTVARRVERISYVVESGGQYQLPARDYFWWDTRKGELQMRFLPAVAVNAGAPSSERSVEQSLRTMTDVDPLKLLFYLAMSGLAAALAWLAYKRLKRFPWNRFIDPLIKAGRRLNQMRKPALPRKLNPDGSAGE